MNYNSYQRNQAHVSRPGLERVLECLPGIVESERTPVYIYSWHALEAAIRLIVDSAGRAGLAQRCSFKIAFFACPNVALLERITKVHPCIGVNCNSLEEIEALKLRGWTQWEKVAFTGGVLSRGALQRIAATGCVMNVASIGNLKLLVECNPSATIGLRLDLIGTALKGVRSKDLEECMKVVREGGKWITAIHAYPGTEIRDSDWLIRHAEVLITEASRCATVSEINFGGGFWYDYFCKTGELAEMTDFEAYFEQVRMIADHHLKGRQVTLTWEPGRVIFAGAGCFATEIIEVRQNEMSVADVYVDASFVNIPTPRIRNRQHLILIVDRHGEPKSGRRFGARFCGCTTLSTDQLLPEPCVIPQPDPGDFLLILDVGAYGRAGSYNFLGKALPPEVLVYDDRWERIRKRQASDHLLQGINANEPINTDSTSIRRSKGLQVRP